MATKKPVSKTKTAPKKSVKKATKNNTKVKNEPEHMSILKTNVSVVYAMAVEALILLLGYLIIMSV